MVQNVAVRTRSFKGLGTVAPTGIPPSTDGESLARCFAPFTGLKNHPFRTATRGSRLSLVYIDIRLAKDLEVVRPEPCHETWVPGNARSVRQTQHDVLGRLEI